MTDQMFDDLDLPDHEYVDMFDEPEDGGPEPIIRDENKSRWVPHPLTGKSTRMSRASAFGGVSADEFTLTEWKLAMAILGVTRNEDLYALGASLELPAERIEEREQGWWKPWADVAHEGMQAARSMSGAHKGTAIHRWSEQIQRGQIELDDVPSLWRRHVEMFLIVHAESALEVNPDGMEQLVCHPGLHNGVTGRSDHFRIGPGGWLVVDDTKTGRNAPAGLDEIAVQLAIYAWSPWWWIGDEFAGEWVPAPKNIRRDVATMTWVPIDRPDESRIIPIDIKWGWEAAKVIAWLKGYRNRAKRKTGLVLPLSVLDEFPGFDR
jgi:hypothetical protein